MSSSGKLFTSIMLILLAAHTSATSDPLEPVNRVIFKINDSVDQAVIRPVAVFYSRITPDFVEKRISNFFLNLTSVTSSLNSIAQFKPGKSMIHLGRFTINSTLGIGGLFDVARGLNLEADPEDFGQTLAVWGLPSGPYLVLPVLGPSTLRDSVSLYADYQTDVLTHVNLDAEIRWALTGLDLLQTRAELTKYESIISGDRYDMFKSIYLQSREFEILDGEIKDEFGADDFDTEGEFLDETF